MGGDERSPARTTLHRRIAEGLAAERAVRRRGSRISLPAMLLVAKLAAGSDYFVDCGAGDDSSTGTEASAAWRSLEKINGTTFSPGDRIHRLRARCFLGHSK